MPSNWGDEFDEELKKDNRVKVGFLFNYMQMSRVLTEIEETAREWDDKYPKQELLKIWGSDMAIIFVLFTLSYNILVVATGLFFIFYGHILIQISKTWKRFHYSGWKYWGMTLLALIVLFAIAWFVRGLIFG